MHEENKALVRNWIDSAWNQRSDKAIEEFCREDVVVSDPHRGRMWGRDGVFEFMVEMITAMPDLSIRIDDLVAEDDLIACRMTAHGVQSGEMLGTKPSGRPVVLPVMAMFRIDNGAFREVWQHWDAFGALQQIGAMGDHDGPQLDRDLPPAPPTRAEVIKPERELNRAVVRCLLDGLWNYGAADLAAEMFHADFEGYDGDSPIIRGVDEWKNWTQGLVATFSRLSMELPQVVAEGDKVAARFTFDARHTGDWMGLPSTGATVSGGGLLITRCAEAKIVQAWQIWDMLKVHKQIESALPQISSAEPTLDLPVKRSDDVSRADTIVTGSVASASS